MNKLENVIAICFEENAIAKINGLSRFETVKSFYKENSISLPVSLTFVQSKSALRLTKDETIAIQFEYIKELQAGKVTEETRSNFEAIGKEDGKVTFTKNYTFSEALENVSLSAIASKLVDILPVTMQEKFQSETRKNSRSLFDISEIPAIIKILEKMQETHKSE